MAEGPHLGNLGNAYAALGETRHAIEHYEQRLVIASEIGDRRGEGIVLGNLGVAYKNLGETQRYPEADRRHRLPNASEWRASPADGPIESSDAKASPRGDR